MAGLFQTTASSTDDAIFETLVWKVSLLSVDQIARTWWGHTKHPVSNTRRRLAELVQAGHIIEHCLPAKPICFPLKPVATWDVGDSDPDCEAVSYRLINRWQQPHQDTVVYTASRHTGYRLGGAGGTVKHPDQATHDLLLAEVYLHCLRVHPLIANHWRGEECYREDRLGQKLPDAIVFNEAHSPEVLLVIESGGAYDAERVQQFHEDCATRGHAYQIW